jgi:chemotaxis protein methyltransferase CheR
MSAPTESGHHPEVALLLEDLLMASGIDYRGYAPDFVADRVEARRVKEGVPDLTTLGARLLDDRACLERIVLDLAPPARPLFASPDWMQAFRADVVPRLRTYPRVRIWHAGCGSQAEDAYAMAIVLREEGLLERTTIYATDVSDVILARARRGLLAEWTETSGDNYRRSGGRASLEEYYAPEDGGAAARPLLKSNIAFAVHSLATDASFNEFHLIACRGVIAQYGAALRERALVVLKDSLVRFGFLALEPGDLPAKGEARAGLQVVRPDIELYRRTA